ncbi:hypothetical protein [Pedobacter frigiditerrae]|uniref:hypothetical protein n=1 Tax=Pedobacter frigiditerrae TaxID=2530452 RepID=UPI00293079DB|nr:hypothetical protein [Pedobacter frigiditerrae]
MTTKKIILISCGIFISVLLITSEFSASADGNNLIGFPFTFYAYLGGKRFPEPETRHSFNLIALLLDILIVFAIPFFALSLYQRKIKDRKEKMN